MTNREPEAAAIPLAQALERVPTLGGERFAAVFRHGTLEIEIYAPRGPDPQLPHARDEAYVVASGRAVFWDGKSRHPVEPGSFLFVAAGRPHRFEEPSDDFATWVLFYGPEGGEVPR